jgi:hypothetical protein
VRGSRHARGVVAQPRRAAAGLAAGRAAAPWQELAGAQAGVVSRAQLLALGLTPGAIDARLAGRRWVGLHPGVYATFTGPVLPLARTWAAVLAAGDGAAIGGRSALWLWGVLDSPELLTTVCVPERRRVVAPAGVRVERRRRLAAHAHPVALPRRLRLEEALLDVTDRAIDEGEVIDLVLRAASSRRTCAERVRQALARRARHRHRTLLGELLTEAVEGVQSALERRYRRGVERAHGLPRGERNAPERSMGRTGAPRTRYRDIRYHRWRVVVELDGLEAHPAWLLRRDRARDNSAALDGDRVLVYGWHETVTERCQVTVEVIRMLWSQGWRGTPRPCDDDCPVADLLAGRPIARSPRSSDATP